MCPKVWIATLGISPTSFYSIHKLFISGTVRVFAKPNRQPLQKTYEALAWMQQYFSLIGDHMPHRMMMIHLPSCLSKVSVYKRMVSEFQSCQKGQFISKSQFFVLSFQSCDHSSCKLFAFILIFEYPFVITDRSVSQNVMCVRWSKLKKKKQWSKNPNMPVRASC